MTHMHIAHTYRDRERKMIRRNNLNNDRYAIEYWNVFGVKFGMLVSGPSYLINFA